MVKLIRLTTANNGKFRADFDAEILIPPGSKLALQNVTFKTNFTPIFIGSEDRLIGFTADKVKRPIGANGSSLPTRSYYGKEGKQQFMVDLEVALNCLTSSIVAQPAPIGSGVVSNATFSDWSVSLFNKEEEEEEQDFNNFNFAYSMLGTPMGGTFAMSNPGGTKNGVWMDWDPYVFQQDVENNILQLAVGIPAITGTKYHMISKDGFKLCKGSGLWMCRIKNSICRSQPGEQGLENNGFGIGVSSQNLKLQGYPDSQLDLPDAARSFEISYNFSSPDGPLTRQGYKYRFNAGPDQQTSVLPQRTALIANGNSDHANDVLWFRINPHPEFPGQQILSGGIWNLTERTGAAGPPNVAQEEILFQKLLTRDEQINGFYPYLWINGEQGGVGEGARTVIDAMCYTLSNDINWEADGWRDNLNALPGFRRDYDILQQFKTGRTDGTGFRLGPVTPVMDQKRWDNLPGIPSPLADLRLSSEVWKYLGFNELGEVVDGYAVIEQPVAFNQELDPRPVLLSIWATWIAEVTAQLDSDDSFIVEVVNIPLDCYDASAVFYGANTAPAERKVAKRGRRKNILMTLPVNDNNAGLVQYDSNTPVFIDIKTTAPLLLKNLSVNILTKDWTPILTEGNSAIITLLLDTGNK